MIDDSEVLAGLVFLSIHARSGLKGPIEGALRAIEYLRDADKKSEIRARPVGSLEISVRLNHALTSMGVKTIGEFEEAMRDEAKLLKDGGRFGFKGKCLRESKEILKEVLG